MEDAALQRAAQILGKAGGAKGGRRRAEVLTPEQRSAIARKAAGARWQGKAIEHAKPTVVAYYVSVQCVCGAMFQMSDGLAEWFCAQCHRWYRVKVSAKRMPTPDAAHPVDYRTNGYQDQATGESKGAGEAPQRPRS